MEKFAIAPLVEGPPEPFKDYHTENAVDLVGYLPFDRHPFTGDKLPDTVANATAGGLYGISRLLYFSNGVTGIMPMQDGSRHYYRAAPSAGALYPTEIYVAVRNLPELADGIYNYQVRDHSLAPVWEGQFWDRLSAATCAHGALEQANVVILLTGCWARGTWRYKQRAYRRALLDTGHVLGNINAVGPACGFGVFPMGGFMDLAINNMLFVDDVEEGALALVALPRLDSLDLDLTGGLPALPSEASHGAVPDPNDALLHQLHQAGNVTEPGVCITAPRHHPDDRDAGYQDADNILALEHTPLDMGEQGGLERLILRRRSARSFIPDPVDLDDLGAMLGFAYQPTLGFTDGSLRQMFDPTLLDTYLIINRSDETAPGIYYYAPQSHELRQVTEADPTETARHICLGQDMAADAGVLVVHTADLDKALNRYGDRAYRYLHLDAGHIGHRLNLAAEAVGLKASGIGGFYDDEVIRLLKLPTQHVVAYITALGTGVDVDTDDE
jgi:SagB-type dehydrogenase family enzyme